MYAVGWSRRSVGRSGRPWSSSISGGVFDSFCIKSNTVLLQYGRALIGIRRILPSLAFTFVVSVRPKHNNYIPEEPYATFLSSFMIRSARSTLKKSGTTYGKNRGMAVQKCVGFCEGRKDVPTRSSFDGDPILPLMGSLVADDQ